MPKVALMSKSEVKDRLAYLARYLRSVSPRVSIYAQLEQERKECAKRLRELVEQERKT